MNIDDDVWFIENILGIKLTDVQKIFLREKVE